MYIIDSDQKLVNLVKLLMNESVIGLDTEFMRRETYYAKLCLIQLSTNTKYYVIDPLVVDIKPLGEILTLKRIVKIFHAPHQDLGIFYHMLGVITENVFDTQEAVKFLRIKNQISYLEICDRVLGLKIEKEQQYREWNIRPLPREMLEYAVQDVKHLIPLYSMLRNELLRQSELDKFEEKMKEFSAEKFYEIDFSEIWKKIKIRERSKKIQNRLQMIASLREEIAIQMDLPRQHVFSDENAILIARNLPSNSKELNINKIRTNLGESNLQKLFDLCEGLKE